MKHEDIKTGAVPPGPSAIIRNDHEDRIAALEHHIVELAKRMQMLIDLVNGMQATQARTIERMLSIHEDPQ